MVGYSPYKHRSKPKKKIGFKLPRIKLGGGAKKWLSIIIGVLIALFIIVYLSLGQLRFFANHYFGLTFFSKDYLILLQNDYELRPTGGFITGFGKVSTFLGNVGDISFQNSYDIDTDQYVEPPYPHEELLKNEWYAGYTFRDANWDPDFPRSANTLLNFYNAKLEDEDVDGIVVINFSMMEDLVDALGGIEIKGEKVTSDRLFSELEFEVNNIDRHSEEALANRKNILGELAPKLISKMKRNPFTSRDVIVKSLNNKNMYLWFKSPGLQNDIVDKGWANQFIVPEKSDFLHVNLANLGAKKADRYIETSTHYFVNIRKEIPEITAEVTIRYPGEKNIHSDDYKGYLRLYVPAKADITGVPIDTREIEEAGLKVLGTQVILPAGSKTTLTYNYTLPRTLLPVNQYLMQLIKQSGSNMEFTVHVETPEGTLARGDLFGSRENRALFKGKLVSDTFLELSILPDELPPYPIEQVFDNINTIRILWSEPIDVSSGSNPDNYTVKDTNRINEANDEVGVIGAKVEHASHTVLTLDGVTDQPLERYQIEIKNLLDQSGNRTSPDPKFITAVQRFGQKTQEEPLEAQDITEIPAE